MRFGVFDIETTGLDVDHDRILQVAVVTCEVDVDPCAPVDVDPCAPVDIERPAAAPLRILESWSTLIRLDRPWQRVGASHIHGLRRRDLFGAPSMRSALCAVGDRLGEVVPVAHNAAFDTGFLLAAARRTRVDLEIAPVVCTLRMSRALDPERTSSHRLGDLCDRHGITLERAHDARDDAEATAAVLPHLMMQLGITSTAELHRFAYESGEGSSRRASG